jgi:hypothetical protein
LEVCGWKEVALRVGKSMSQRSVIKLRQPRLFTVSQPHLSRLHQCRVFDVKRHASEILCRIFRASAPTMLLFAHTSVSVSSPTRELEAAKPIDFVAKLASLSSVLVLFRIPLNFPNI